MKSAMMCLKLCLTAMLLFGVAGKRSNAQTSPAHRYALLIGVSDVHIPGLKVPPLPGVANDLMLMERTAKRLGFRPLPPLLSSRRSDIKDALDHLVDKCRTGDRVWIYISSHGTGVEIAGQQVEPALLTADAKMTFKDWEQHTKPLRAKKVRLYWLVDACFAPQSVRGGIGEVKFCPGETLTARDVSLVRPRLGQAVITAGMHTEKAYQIALEGNQETKVSACTLAFYRVMLVNPAAASGRVFTYRWLDQQLKRYLACQTSLTYAVNPDAPVFDATPQPGGIAIKSVNADIVTLEEGRFAGLRRGDVIHLYPRNGRGQAVEAEVVRVGNMDAQARCRTPLSTAPTGWGAYRTLDEMLRYIRVRTKSLTGAGEALCKAVRQQSQGRDDFLFQEETKGEVKGGVDDPPWPVDVTITFAGKETPAATVQLPQGITFQITGQDIAQAARQVCAALDTSYLLIVLEQLRPTHAAFAVRLTSDRPRYAVGDRMRLCVEANRNCYLYLLDVGSSGTVSQLLPNGKQSGQVKAHQRLAVPPENEDIVIDVSSPGTDVLLVIATTRPLELPDQEEMPAGERGIGLTTRSAHMRLRSLAASSDTQEPLLWAAATLVIPIAAK